MQIVHYRHTYILHNAINADTALSCVDQAAMQRVHYINTYILHNAINADTALSCVDQAAMQRVQYINTYILTMLLIIKPLSLQSKALDGKQRYASSGRLQLHTQPPLLYVLDEHSSTAYHQLRA